MNVGGVYNSFEDGCFYDVNSEENFKMKEICLGFKRNWKFLKK